MKKNQSKYDTDYLEKLAVEMLKEKKVPLDDLKKEEWMLGIDEAGRGPVFGPMVYAACYWPKKYNEILQKSVFDDSKKLTEPQRDSLFILINRLNGEMLRYECIQLSAEFLSINQQRFISNNLNAISHQTALTLIQNAISNGYNIKQCFIDTVGPKMQYKKYLDDNLKSLETGIVIIVEEKADSKFQTVSAASICAKVTRDQEISRIKKDVVKEDIGCGYPSDPKTQQFMKQNLIPFFCYPNVIRFSWQTATTAIENTGQSFQYYEENNNKAQEEIKNSMFLSKRPPVQKFRGVFCQQIFF